MLDSQDTPKRIQLLLSKITEDPEIQPREKINPATVEHYAERMQAGDIFPPLAVFKVDGKYLLASGYTRLAALRQIGGSKMIEVSVHEGTRQDAILFAAKSNAKHGQPLSNADKRRAVMMVLKECPEQSSNWIANHCKVSHTFVDTVRKSLATLARDETRTFETKRGTVSKIRIGNIGKKQSLDNEEIEEEAEWERKAKAKTKSAPVEQDEEESEPAASSDADQWVEAQQALRITASALVTDVAKLTKLDRDCDRKATKRVLPEIGDAVDRVVKAGKELDRLFPK
jgi:hypothetical protein